MAGAMLALALQLSVLYQMSLRNGYDVIIRAWTVEKRSFRFHFKFYHNTVRWFQAGIRRVWGVLVTWWCLMIFKSLNNSEESRKKFVKHHRVTSTPKTLRKLAWSHLTVFWLNFEKNRRFLFCRVQAMNMSEILTWVYHFANRVLPALFWIRINRIMISLSFLKALSSSLYSP